MRYILPSLYIVGIFFWAGSALAQMSSTNFEIRFDSVGFGGSDSASSASYQLRDTLGDTGAGNSASSSYQVDAGYRGGIFDQVVTFDTFAQTGTSQVPTGLAGTVVTVPTAGFSIGDFVAVVQNVGASQVAGIGRIIAIGGGTITLDELKDGGATPVIDGTNDVVYRMTEGDVGFGDLDDTAVFTRIIGWNVSIDVDGGYVVQLSDDGNLRDGANDINDVADGSVTAGAEEYGARSSDTTLAGSTFDTVDTAITTTLQDIADESTVSFESRNFLTLKAAIAAGTADGSYAHTLNLIVSGNY